MKKMFKNLMLVAVAAMAFVGCNNDLISVDTLKKPTVITFNASMEDDTRTSMTDENSDGKYEVNWSAGDQVAFVVYGDNDSIIEIQTATVAEAGASAELTVEFNSELTTGQRIVAYCNYDCGESYWGYYFNTPDHSYQYPKQDDVEKHYISAEYTYNGEAVAPLKFSHDYAYAKMVVENLEGIDRIEMTFNDTKTINLYCYNVTNNIFMFTCPAMEVNKINVEVTTNEYDENYQPVCYSFNKELAAGKLTFNKGRIAKFTIKDWKSILASPYVEATEVTEDSITFSWEAVEGAKDYTYTITTGDSWDPTIVVTDTTAETSVVVRDLEPLTEYRITVVANSKNSESHATSKPSNECNATTGADRSTLDELFTEVVVFDNMTKLENYTNTYLFTTDGGGTTINDKFMYLRFNNEIDFSKSGEYSIDDLYSEYGECCIWIGHAVDGCNGYGNGYNLGFTPYHFFNNPGDTYIIYVDVVDGKSTITVYANNASWWSALKFKGVYVEKSLLATPVVTTTVERNTITATWEAIEGAANYTVTCGNESKTIEGTTTATFEGLDYATEYTVSVVANPADTTKYKASLAGEATATTVTLTTLATPSNLNYTIEGDIVTITWDAVENATNYYVYAWNQPYETTTDTNSAQFTLAEYGYYHFYIIAKAKVDSLYKDSYEAYVGVSYEDPRQILPAPTNVTATVDGASATISWDPVEGADGYQVYYYLNGENRVDVKEPTITLEVGYSVQNLYIYVFAIANEDNTQYLSSTSWDASVVVNTEEDPSVAADAITSFEYLGRYWEIADSNDSTTGGEFVYLVTTADGNEYTINMYYDYCNADGTIKEGTYNYCYNTPDAMYSSWAGFSIISDSYYYNSTLTVTADSITLYLVGADGVIGKYVYSGEITK